MSKLVEPGLGREEFSFVTDFPASQACMACIRAGSPPVAERFELFIDGMEVANGSQGGGFAGGVGHGTGQQAVEDVMSTLDGFAKMPIELRLRSGPASRCWRTGGGKVWLPVLDAIRTLVPDPTLVVPEFVLA